VLEGITIDLTGAGEEEPGSDPLCQSKHVECTNHIGLVPAQRSRITQTISKEHATLHNNSNLVVTLEPPKGLLGKQAQGNSCEVNSKQSCLAGKGTVATWISRSFGLLYVRVKPTPQLSQIQAQRGSAFAFSSPSSHYQIIK
jgi:hypothetical protein